MNIERVKSLWSSHYGRTATFLWAMENIIVENGITGRSPAMTSPWISRQSMRPRNTNWIQTPESVLKQIDREKLMKWKTMKIPMLSYVEVLFKFRPKGPLGLLCIPGDHWRCRYLLLGITFHFEFPEKGAVDVFKQHWASLHYVREIVRRTRPSYLKCFARGVGGWLSIKHWEYRIGFENMFSFTCDSPLLSTSILSAGGNKQHTTNFQWSMLPSFRMIGYWLGSAKAV